MSGYSVERLAAKDYDEWLYVLNTTFTKQNQREMDFEFELPKMCIKDDFHMNMHFAVKENGRICSLLGVYPIRTQIGDKTLMFSTVGNVATLPEHEGKGYMSTLMGFAMDELDRIGADASRLGGARQRYNRYGYESAGRNYNFEITGMNTKYCFGSKEEITFKPVNSTDCCCLSYINNLRKSAPMHVIRSESEDYSGDYLTLCAWKSIPKIALNKNGEPVGYVSISEDGTAISDIMAKDFKTLKNMIFNLQINAQSTISFCLPAYEKDAIRYFSSVAQEMSVSPSCHFKIINFDKVADALLKVKLQLTPDMVQGEKVIEIKDFGNLLIYNKNGDAFCEKTNKSADLTLNKLSAARLLFGTFDASSVADCGSFLSSVLPLPLSWNTLDRV